MYQRRTFETAPGEVVSLGSAIVTSLGNSKFANAWVENHQDIASDLLKTAPVWLVDRLQNGDFRLAKDGFASRELIDAILVNRFSFGAQLGGGVKKDWPVSFQGGALGTIVAYQLLPSGTQPIRVIHTGETMRFFNPCDATNDRLVCISSNVSRNRKDASNRERTLAFVDWNQETVITKEIPVQGEIPRVVFLFRESGVIVVDHNFGVYSSVDNGATWQSLASLVKPGLMQIESGVHVEEGDGKLYLLLNGKSSAVAVVNMTSGSISEIPLPEKVDSVRSIVWTEPALVIGPEWTLASNSKMYARKWGSEDWTVSEVPQGRCMKAWAGDSSSEVVVQCGGMSVNNYRSSDLGVTWQN